MATNVLPNDKSNSNNHVQCFDLFHLIWLDDDDSGKDENDEYMLRSTLIKFTKYQDVISCRQYIENLSANNRLVLLISNHLSNEIIPTIHKLQQVSLICVYGVTNEQSFEQFSKVKIIVAKLKYFISTIRLNFRMYQQDQRSSLNNMFTISTGNSTLEVKGEFVFFQTLIDCLLKMKPNKRDENELRSYLEKKYENNTKTLKFIRTFYDTYSPDEIFDWYTTQPFVYDIMNTALRQQDIHMMVLWRSFFFDMYHQLRELQLQDQIEVYL
ncbi:unnamed protein product, partial [Adineta ricciae]